MIFGFAACPEGENPFTVKGNLKNNYNNKYLMERCQNAKTPYLMLQYRVFKTTCYNIRKYSAQEQIYKICI